MPRGSPKARLVHDVPREGWTPVESSNLQSVWYDPALKLMYVKFKKSTYAYSNVPPEIHSALMSAGSKGGYFWANVRDKFPTAGPLAG